MLERFEKYVMPEPNTGCFFWIGGRRGFGKALYGAFRVGQKKESAHRLAYEHWKGPIPDGYCIDHLCRTYLCVNPDHLRAVTKRQNTLENSESIQAKNAKKTHCLRGHEFTPENTYVLAFKGRRAGGFRRICRACHKEANLAWWRKKRGES